MARNEHITVGLRRNFVEHYAVAVNVDLKMWDHKSLDDIFDTFAARVYARSREGAVRITSPDNADAKINAKIETKVLAPLANELRQLKYEPHPEILRRVSGKVDDGS